MSDSVRRFRMFAGPNGSGKSTLKNVLRPELLGVYLNPDDVESELKVAGHFDPGHWGIRGAAAEALCFFSNSQRLTETQPSASAWRLTDDRNGVDLSEVAITSYVAAEAVDFLCHKLLEAGVSFTVETVMSHPSKVDWLAEARRRGFRTYLYYIATEDPEINVSRVKNRVRLGGHDVPEQKIRSRYKRSLDLLVEAIKQTSRAYLFDNSNDSGPESRTWIAEVESGSTLVTKADTIPDWCSVHVLQKMTRDDVA